MQKNYQLSLRTEMLTISQIYCLEVTTVTGVALVENRV